MDYPVRNSLTQTLDNLSSGSGKSSLAASVVREEDLFLHQFDSVIWMMDHHENSKDLTRFMSDLYVYLMVSYTSETCDLTPSQDSTELSGKESPPLDKASIIHLTKLVRSFLSFFYIYCTSNFR